MSFRAFWNKNGTAIATGGSIILTVAAVIIAIKKAKNGSEIREKYEEDFEDANGNAQLEAEAKIEYAKNLIKTYGSSIACAGGAIILAYISHKSDAKKIANLGAALALNEDKIKQLYGYIERKLEPNMKKNEIEQDISESDPETCYDGNPIKARKRYRKEDPVIFRDSWSGTKFESTMKDYYTAVERAENILLRSKGYGINYNKWQNLLGLEDTPAGAEVGWKPNEFRSYLQKTTDDGEIIYIICYKTFPNSQYLR